MIFWPRGEVGIIFGSVKIKSIRTTQVIIDDVNRCYQANMSRKQNFAIDYLRGVKISYDILTPSWDSFR